MRLLTVYDLVFRNMKKNITHYYLYFFALIFSVALYYVFASLQFDSTIAHETSLSSSMTSGFKVANVLLIVIASVFIIYANSIFLTRRSREIGLYQLIGLTKSAVARMLLLENFLLSIGALIVGVFAGTLVSRLFLLLLLKIVGLSQPVSMTFSQEALMRTLLVFFIVIVVTSVQMIRVVYKKSLIQLFQADQQTDVEVRPQTWKSAILAIVGIGFITFGYWLSGRMINSWLIMNMFLVLGSTIFGTYLVFKVTISWIFNRIRRAKNGHVSLKDSLSIASLMHRMKGNANSLTVITVLSAMAMTMISVAYSAYFSASESARNAMPQDYQFYENGVNNLSLHTMDQLKQQFDQNGIHYTESIIPTFYVELTLLDEVNHPFIDNQYNVGIVSKEDLKHTRYQQVEGETTFHYPSMTWIFKQVKWPLHGQVGDQQLTLQHISESSVFNATFNEASLVVEPEVYEQLKAFKVQDGETRYALNVADDQQKEAFALYEAILQDVEMPNAYYGVYEESIQGSGLFIFIAAFLGLVFLISTGSILYFKQMTEAEQEKKYYRTLRQLGFSISEIMGGIKRKQLFVFGLPLLIGLLHSWFAVKSADIFFSTNVTVPTLIAMGVYSSIYALFALLAIGYYKNIVKESM